MPASLEGDECNTTCHSLWQPCDSEATATPGRHSPLDTAEKKTCHFHVPFTSGTRPPLTKRLPLQQAPAVLDECLSPFSFCQWRNCCTPYPGGARVHRSSSKRGCHTTSTVGDLSPSLLATDTFPGSRRTRVSRLRRGSFFCSSASPLSHARRTRRWLPPYANVVKTSLPLNRPVGSWRNDGKKPVL